MSYDGTLTFDTDINTNGFQKSADSLLGKINSVFGGITAFTILEQGVQAVVTSIDSAVSRFDTLERFPQIMEQMGFSADVAEASIQKISTNLQGLPTAVDTVVNSVKRISTINGDLEYSTDLTLSLNNAFLSSGTSSEAASRGLEQYIQIISRGKPEMEDWKTLQETMPYALRKVAESFGFAGDSATNDFYAALQNGEITVAQMNDRFIELSNEVGGFADVAKSATGGVNTAFTNMKTAIVRGVANVIDEVDKMNAEFGGIEGIIESVTDGIDASFEFIVENLEEIAVVAQIAGAAFVAWKVAMIVGEATKALNIFRTAALTAEATNTVLTLSTNLNTTAEMANAGVIGVKATAMGVLTSATFAQTVASEILAAVQAKLNLLWAANPVGLVTAGLIVLTTAVVAVTKALEEESEEAIKLNDELDRLNEKQDALADSAKASAEAYTDSVSALQATSAAAKNAVDEVERLASANDGTAISEQNLITAIDTANSIMPELSLAYNEQTGEVENLTRATDDYIDSMSEASLAELQYSRRKELIDEQTNAIIDLAIAQKALTEAEQSGLHVQEQRVTGTAQIIQVETQRYQDLKQSVAEYEAQIASTTEDIAIFDEAMVGLSETQETAIQTTTSNGESIEELATQYGTSVAEITAQMQSYDISLDEWSASAQANATAQEEAMARVSDAVTNMADTYLNSNEKINLDNETSLAERIANLQANQALVESYGANLQTITQAAAQNSIALTDGFLAELEQGTPEAMAIARDLVESLKASPEQLATLNDLYSNIGANDIIGGISGGITGAPPVDVTPVIQGIATQITEQAPAIGESMTAVTTAMSTGMTTTPIDISPVIQGINTQVTTAAPAIGANMTSVTSAMASNVAADTTIAAATTQKLTEMNTSVTTQTPIIAESTAGVVRAMADKISTDITINAAITKQLDDIVQKITTEAPNIGNTMNDVMAAMADTVTADATVNSAVTQMLETVKNTATSIASTFNSVGVQMCNGIAAGINSGRSAVVSAMTDAVTAAISAAKSAADIRSPSRIFNKEVGQMFMFGMAGGIDDGTIDVLRQMTQSVHKVISTAKDGLTFSEIAAQYIPQMQELFLVPQAGIATAGGTPGATGGSVINTELNMTINSHDALSESEMTSEAEALLKRMDWMIK